MTIALLSVCAGGIVAIGVAQLGRFGENDVAAAINGGRGRDACAVEQAVVAQAVCRAAADGAPGSLLKQYSQRRVRPGTAASVQFAELFSKLPQAA